MTAYPYILAALGMAPLTLGLIEAFRMAAQLAAQIDAQIDAEMQAGGAE